MFCSAKFIRNILVLGAALFFGSTQLQAAYDFKFTRMEKVDIDDIKDEVDAYIDTAGLQNRNYKVMERFIHELANALLLDSIARFDEIYKSQPTFNGAVLGFKDLFSNWDDSEKSKALRKTTPLRTTPLFKVIENLLDINFYASDTQQAMALAVLKTCGDTPSLDKLKGKKGGTRWITNSRGYLATAEGKKEIKEKLQEKLSEIKKFFKIVYNYPRAVDPDTPSQGELINCINALKAKVNSLINESSEQKDKNSLRAQLVTLFTVYPQLLKLAAAIRLKAFINEDLQPTFDFGDNKPAKQCWSLAIAQAYGIAPTYTKFKGFDDISWGLDLTEQIMYANFWHATAYADNPTDLRRHLLFLQLQPADRHIFMRDHVHQVFDSLSERFSHLKVLTEKVLEQLKEKRSELDSRQANEAKLEQADYQKVFERITGSLGVDITDLDIRAACVKLLEKVKEAELGKVRPSAGAGSTLGSLDSSSSASKTSGAKKLNRYQQLFIPSETLSDIKALYENLSGTRATYTKIHNKRMQLLRDFRANRPEIEAQEIIEEFRKKISDDDSSKTSSLGSSLSSGSSASSIASSSGSTHSHSPSDSYDPKLENLGVRTHLNEELPIDFDRLIAHIQSMYILDCADKVYELGVIIRSLDFWAQKFDQLAILLDTWAAQKKKEHGGWWEWFYDPDRLLMKSRRNDVKSKFYEYKDAAVRLRDSAKKYREFIAIQQQKQARILHGQHWQDMMEMKEYEKPVITTDPTTGKDTLTSETLPGLKLDSTKEFWAACVAQDDEELSDWIDSLSVAANKDKKRLWTENIDAVSAEQEGFVQQRLLDSELEEWMSTSFYGGNRGENAQIAQEVVKRVNNRRKTFYHYMEDIQRQSTGLSRQFHQLSNAVTEGFVFDPQAKTFRPEFGIGVGFGGIQDMAKREQTDFTEKSKIGTIMKGLPAGIGVGGLTSLGVAGAAIMPATGAATSAVGTGALAALGTTAAAGAALAGGGSLPWLLPVSAVGAGVIGAGVGAVALAEAQRQSRIAEKGARRSGAIADALGGDKIKAARAAREQARRSDRVSQAILLAPHKEIANEEEAARAQAVRDFEKTKARFQSPSPDLPPVSTPTPPPTLSPRGAEPPDPALSPSPDLPPVSSAIVGPPDPAHSADLLPGESLAVPAEPLGISPSATPQAQPIAAQVSAGPSVADTLEARLAALQAQNADLLASDQTRSLPRASELHGPATTFADRQPTPPAPSADLAAVSGPGPEITTDSLLESLGGHTDRATQIQRELTTRQHLSSARTQRAIPQTRAAAFETTNTGQFAPGPEGQTFLAPTTFGSPGSFQTGSRPPTLQRRHSAPALTTTSLFE